MSLAAVSGRMGTSARIAGLPSRRVGYSRTMAKEFR